MKKLTLDLDHLVVDTFSPVDETAGADGTVRGHDSDESPRCTDFKTCRTCVGGDTCGWPCNTIEIY
jgi:hypothetical protein